jgi:hypothetical protein
MGDQELTKDFKVLAFVHDRRISNKESHCLAKSSVLFESGRHVWLMASPECVCTKIDVVD